MEEQDYVGCLQVSELEDGPEDGGEVGAQDQAPAGEFGLSQATDGKAAEAEYICRKLL